MVKHAEILITYTNKKVHLHREEANIAFKWWSLPFPRYFIDNLSYGLVAMVTDDVTDAILQFVSVVMQAFHSNDVSPVP